MLHRFKQCYIDFSEAVLHVYRHAEGARVETLFLTRLRPLALVGGLGKLCLKTMKLFRAEGVVTIS